MNLEIEQTVYNLEIETTISDNINNVLEIEASTSETVQISSDSIGIILASDIIGLDSYIENYLDNYAVDEIDCGTP